MVMAPESELVDQITTAEQKEAVAAYLQYVKGRSDRDRISETKQITGCFTGAYAQHPFTGKAIPIWISEYVLAGYGTGAIMAVPCGDQRDFNFANHFNIPITNIFGTAFDGTAACTSKDVLLTNSSFLDGMNGKAASEIVIQKLTEANIGRKKVNYKMHDAGFSRQRYWGEPFPIQWKNGAAYPLTEEQLPLQLPVLEKYGPGPEGEGPLANVSEWTGQHLETSTMPGYAGSSWYFLRYMDPQNQNSFCDRKISDYWGPVNVYIGGTEHAVGHLLYSRMWTKVLFDLGLIGFDEPFKKLINQGMIQGSSRFAYRIKNSNTFVSFGLKDQYQTDRIHVDVNMVDGFELDTNAFKNWKPDLENAEFILEEGKYIRLNRANLGIQKVSKGYTGSLKNCGDSSSTNKTVKYGTKKNPPPLNGRSYTRP